jgi:hypothetical protein
MFNSQELKNLYILLERTQLSGKESITCAILMQKIEKLLNEPSPITGTGEPQPTSEVTGTNEPKE